MALTWSKTTYYLNSNQTAPSTRIESSVTRICLASWSCLLELFFGLLWSHFILTILLKGLAEKIYSSLKIWLKNLTCVVCFDMAAGRRLVGNSSHQCQQKKVKIESWISFFSKSFLGKYYYKKWSLQTQEHIKAQSESSKNFKSYPSVMHELFTTEY